MANIEFIAETIDEDALFEGVRNFFKFSAPYKQNPFRQNEGWTNFEVTRDDKNKILVNAERFRVEHEAIGDGKFIPFDGPKTVCVITVSKMVDGRERVHLHIYRDELAPHFKAFAESTTERIKRNNDAPAPNITNNYNYSFFGNGAQIGQFAQGNDINQNSTKQATDSD